MSIEDVLTKLQEIQDYRETNKLLYYKPYPFQQKFHNAIGHKTDQPADFKGLMAANQIGKCGTSISRVLTSDGEKSFKEIFGKEIEVLTYPDLSPRKVTAWVRKPAEECFRFVMSDGRWFECPNGHQILTSGGFSSVEHILAGLPPSVYEPPGRPVPDGLFRRVWHFLRNARIGVRRLMGTIAGCLDHYLVGSHLCGVLPLYDQGGVQVFAPSQAGVRPRSARLSRAGGLVCRYIGSLYEWLRHHSSLDAFHQTLARSFAFSARAFSPVSVSYTSRTENELQSHYLWHRGHKAGEVHDHQFQSSSSDCSVITIDGVEIVSVYSVGVHDLYDMEVEDRHHYIAAGMVHHNSTCGGFETAIHLTGVYPDWWEGIRFTKPVNWICGTSTNDNTRDILQKELMGDPKVLGDLGKGAIPKHMIGSVVKKPGVPNAIDSVMVKHVAGWSTCNFRAYEQGPHKWMGHRYDGAWLDEEAPQEILSQVQRAGLAKQVFVLLMTFTPENGVTQIVDQLMTDLKKGQVLIQASWDDAPHMTPEMREANLAKFPAHERDMRSKGIPLMGSGLVFPVAEEVLRVEPFAIPRHWSRICGIDFGWDHPFGAVWIAHDRETDTVYVYDCYKESKVVPPVHASAIKRRGEWIPIVWPHDGYVHDKGSGIPLAQSYRREGLNLLKEKFSNPPGPGAKEGSGGNGVEVGISQMLTMMEEGRFKVFSNLNLWWEEFRMYHRKDGKIVALKDDLMASTRYGVMSLRFAHTEPVRRIRQDTHQGITNWQ